MMNRNPEMETNENDAGLTPADCPRSFVGPEKQTTQQNQCVC